MLLEQATESICQRVGCRTWFLGRGFCAASRASSAAEHTAKVRCKGGIGGGSTDGDGDTVFECGSSYASYRATCGSTGDHTHELASDAAYTGR